MTEDPLGTQPSCAKQDISWIHPETANQAEGLGPQLADIRSAMTYVRLFESQIVCGISASHGCWGGGKCALAKCKGSLLPVTQLNSFYNLDRNDYCKSSGDPGHIRSSPLRDCAERSFGAAIALGSSKYVIAKQVSEVAASICQT